MSQIQNVSVSLTAIVNSIHKGIYVVPQFQRTFVWKIPEIESLGDSILRGYPISSILTMDVGGSLDVSYSSLRTDGTSVGIDNKIYILDGQQRLTSLAKIFAGLDEQRIYYFDLLGLLCENFPEDNLQNLTNIKEKLNNNNNQFSPILDSLCRSFSMNTSKDYKETKQFNRFISAKAVIENRFGSIINKFSKLLQGISEDQIDKYLDYLNAVMGAVGSYSVAATVLPKDSDLEMVVRVFEKVNTTGVKLTLIDLVNAKTFGTTTNSNKSGGFAAYLDDSIYDYLYTKHKSSDYFSGILNYNTKTKLYTALSRIVRTITITESLQKGQQSKLTNKYMLSKDAKFWYEMWDTHGVAILDFYSWLSNEGIDKIGNLTFFEYIGAIVAQYPILSKNKIFLNEVKKHIYYITISKKGFNRSDIEVFNQFHEFAKYLMNTYDMEKYDYKNLLPKTPIDLNADDISKIRLGNAYQAIKYIIYHENQNGLGTVDLLGNKININNNTFEDHHIIAKARTKQNKKSIFYSIANIAVLDRTVNQVDIKDKNIHQYMAEIQNVKSNFNFILDHNLLSHYDSSLDEQEIILKRADKISKLINGYFS